MPDQDGVAAGSTNLESQLTRSAASATSENVPNAKRRKSPSENVPDAKRRKGKWHYWRKAIRKAIGPAASAAAEAPTTAPAASAAAEAPATRRNMDEHRILLAEAAIDHGWGGPPKKCNEIIQAAEALPELTSTERITYLTALDEYDYPDWSSDEECDAADEGD